MRPVYLNSGTYSSSLSVPCVLDQYLTPTDVLLAVELYGGAGGNYSVQYSPDDPFAVYATDYNTNANWYNHPTLVNLATDGVDSLTVPARAVRFASNSAASGSSATPRLVVVQAGVM